MTRYHSEVALIHRRVREWMVLAKAPARPGGRFRKRKPLDCGKARCSLCSALKLLKVPTARDLRAAATLRDEMRRLDET